MADTIDDTRKALTGWFKGKTQDSGKGGDRRNQTIMDVVDGDVTGTPPPDRSKQSTDNVNGY